MEEGEYASRYTPNLRRSKVKHGHPAAIQLLGPEGKGAGDRRMEVEEGWASSPPAALPHTHQTSHLPLESRVASRPSLVYSSYLS